MPLPNQAKVEHRECRELALALEGIAGALRMGRKVESTDLSHAAFASEQVWEAGPDPGAWRDEAFEEARSRFSHAAAGCTAGSARESAQVERAAQDMALELRWMASDLATKPARKPAPDQGKAIRELQSKYARFGYRPAA